jgi:hypothetical protein
MIALTAVLLVATGFVLKYVFPFCLSYNPAGFDVLWTRRGWLLLHMSSGMMALLIGPWVGVGACRLVHGCATL